MTRISFHGHVPAFLKSRQQESTNPPTPSPVSPGPTGARSNATMEGQARTIYLGFFKIKVNPPGGGATAGPGAGRGAPREITQLRGRGTPPGQATLSDTLTGAGELGNLPEDVPQPQDGVTALTLDETMAMSGTEPPLRNAIEPQQATRIKQLVENRVSQATSLDEMRALIGQINSLPPEQRPEVTQQAMLHLHALPMEGRRPALAALSQIQPPTAEPRGLDMIFRHQDANSAADGGENVADVASVFGITTPERLIELERVAARSVLPNTAGAAMRAGGNVQDVARQFDMTTPEGIFELEKVTVEHGGRNTAGAAVLAGGNVQGVAREFGITTQKWIIELEMMTTENGEFSGNANTAGAAMAAGGNVLHVAKEFGITSPVAIGRLERQTVKSVRPNTAGAAMRAGGNVLHVAEEFGITTPEWIRALERLTIFSLRRNTAGAAMAAGGHVLVVAEEFGIAMPAGIHDLEAATINSSLHDRHLAAALAGESLQFDAEEEYATGHSLAPNTAGAAMRDGGSVQEVAKAFGITSEKGLLALNPDRTDAPMSLAEPVRWPQPWGE